MFPLQIALNLGQRAHTNQGRTLRGRWGLMPRLPKRGLVVPKVFTPIIVTPVPFAWKQSRILSPFINIGSGPKHKKTIFDISAPGAHEK